MSDAADRRRLRARSSAAVVVALALACAGSAFGPGVAMVDAVRGPGVQQEATVLSAPSSALRRYPYLTDVVRTNATLNWATDTSKTTAYATYGIDGQEGCTAHTATATRTSQIGSNSSVMSAPPRCDASRGGCDGGTSDRSRARSAAIASVVACGSRSE